MENKFEKIAISFLIVAVLFLGIMYFIQQKTLNQVKSGAFADNSGNSTAKPLQNNSSVDANATESISQNNSEILFPVEIKAISGDVLDVEAKLVKIDSSAKSQDKPYDISTKTLKIMVNEKTKFFGIKREEIRKEDLKVGEKMMVNADISPFQTESLTALETYSINDWPSELKEQP